MRRVLVLYTIVAAIATAGYEPLSVCSDWLIQTYKIFISPLQGKNICNFWPTCSQFTREAIRTRGFWEGALIGADRLMRCHPGAWLYLDRYYFGISHDRLIDPVCNHILSYTNPAGPQNLTLITVDNKRMTPQAATEEKRGFAEFLYRQKDYSRAASEFLRLAYAEVQPKMRCYYLLMAGEALLCSYDYHRARIAFSLTPDSVAHRKYGIARVWFGQALFDSARAELIQIAHPHLRSQARILLGWSLFKEYEFKEGSQVFHDMQSKPDSFATELVQATLPLTSLDGTDLVRRNRLAGTLLSVFLPGAGQIYAGRAYDGAYSFLTVASTGLAAWWYATHPGYDRTRLKLYLSSLLTALFYAGNVYGANIAVRDYNRFQERNYLAKAERILDSLDLAPDYSEYLLPVADSSSTESH